MADRGWHRAGATSGVSFVVLSLLGAFLYPEQPRSDSAPAVTLAWVHDHRVALQWGMIISLAAAATFIWFAGWLRSSLAGADHPVGPVVLGAGVAVAVMSALAVMPTAIMAFMDSQPAGLHDATLIRMLGDLNTVFFAAVSAMNAVFMLALGVVVVRGELLSRWLGWVALAVAAGNAVAVWVEITFSSYHGKAWNAIGWGAYIGFLAVVLIGSVTSLRTRPAGTSTPFPAPA